MVWGHSGDLIFRQAGSDTHGKQIIVSVANALPHGPQTGNIVVRPYAAGATYSQELRLDKAQQVNGIILERVSSLTTSTATVVPVAFGGGNGNGIVSGDFSVNAAKFAYSKTGMGTLVVSNATFGAFVATGGVIRVTARTTAVFDTLALTNAQLVVERGATLTVGTLAYDHASVDLMADGVIDATTMTRGADATWRNVLPATLTTNTVSSINEASLSAWAPVVKEGGKYTVCRTPSNAQGAPLDVRGGVLKMGGEVCHNPYWRLIVKKAFKDMTHFTDANYPSFDQTVYLFLGHLGQFAYDGSYAAGATSDGGIGTEATALAEGAATSKNPLFFWNTTTTWRNVTNQYPNVTKKTVDPIVGGGTAQLNPAVLVNESDATINRTEWYDTPGTSSTTLIANWGSCLAFTNQILKVDDPSTWEIVTWRQKPSWAQKGTTSYNFQRAVNVDNQDRPHPRHWELQSSADGQTWVTMDVQTNAFLDLGWEGLKLNAQFNYTYNRHVPYLLRSTQANWRFDTFGPVQVAAGAKLDLDEVPEANIAFNGLAVDLTAGAGTITKFAAAQNGTLALAHPRAEDAPDGHLKSRVRLPLTISKFISTENLDSWSVTLDGTPAPASKVLVENGGLVVATLNGTLILFR